MAVMIKLQKNRLFFQCIRNRNRSQLNDNVTFEMNVTFPKHQPFEFYHIKLSTFIFSIFERELFFCSIPTSQMKRKSWISHQMHIFPAACIHSINSRSFSLHVNSRPSTVVFAFFFHSAHARRRWRKFICQKYAGGCAQNRTNENMYQWISEMMGQLPIVYIILCSYFSWIWLVWNVCIAWKVEQRSK